MNKRQKAVQQVLLNDEKAVLKNLKKTYKDAIKECDDLIAKLLAQEQTQSKIYQIEYQQMIRSQLNKIYQNMQQSNYATISEYLQKCYTDSFVGCMYDLQGQGVPLAFPIDQTQVTKAIQVDSKISKGLYQHLGVNVDKLKDSIRQELTRGIANGQSYSRIAKAISQRSDVDFNRSLRIARTEGHRVQTSATLDAQIKAKDAGADIVKQWDATLDSFTRDTHRELDGQIVDVEDDFVIPSTGARASAPSLFGDPAEDCNCRCCLLQRAKWAIGGDITKMDNEQGEKHLVSINESSYQAFSTAYFNAVGHA